MVEEKELWKLDKMDLKLSVAISFHCKSMIEVLQYVANRGLSYAVISTAEHVM